MRELESHYARRSRLVKPANSTRLAAAPFLDRRDILSSSDPSDSNANGCRVSPANMCKRSDFPREAWRAHYGA